MYTFGIVGSPFDVYGPAPPSSSRGVLWSVSTVTSISPVGRPRFPVVLPLVVTQLGEQE